MAPPDFSRILEHPDCDDIISKLLTGVPAKDITDWLKLKYDKPEQGHLRLPSTLLKTFADSNIDLYNSMKTDLEKVKNGGAIEKKIAASLKNNKTYAERLNEVAEKEIDVIQTMTDTVHLIKTRIEQVFDKVQQNPESFKPDYALIKWFDTLLRAVEQYDKIVNNRPDQVIQHNVNVQMIEQNTVIFQNAIREILEEMDPEQAFVFMDKLSRKMAMLKPPEPEVVLSQDKRLKEAQLLAMKAEDVD